MSLKYLYMDFQFSDENAVSVSEKNADINSMTTNTPMNTKLVLPEKNANPFTE